MSLSTQWWPWTKLQPAVRPRSTVSQSRYGRPLPPLALCRRRTGSPALGRARAGGRPLGLISRGRLRWGRGEGCWGGRAREINCGSHGGAIISEKALANALLPRSVPALRRPSCLARRPEFAEWARGHLPVKDCKRSRHRRPLPDLLKNLRRNSRMFSRYLQRSSDPGHRAALYAIVALCCSRSVQSVVMAAQLELHPQICCSLLTASVGSVRPRIYRSGC